MKLLFIIAFLIPLALAAQTATPQQQAMEKFKKFYNTGQGDSINAMFGGEWVEMKLTRPLWTNAAAAEALKLYGKLKSFEYVGIDTTDPQQVYVFQTVFSKKGANTTSLTLDKDNKLGTFRFITTSDEIVRLVKNAPGRR